MPGHICPACAAEFTMPTGGSARWHGFGVWVTGAGAYAAAVGQHDWITSAAIGVGLLCIVNNWNRGRIACPTCAHVGMVPLDSPRGRALHAQHAPAPAGDGKP